ncbi:MAG: hypothetical protein EBS24_07530 [Chitinophagia bacterium]|nr:hypothetical protein [Chitinophagia bacterium]
MRIVLAILLCFYVSISWSQFEGHYWSHQFGSKGLLLNGAVISSSGDETNIFYNPGAIGLDSDLGFSFSFLSPSYSNYRLENFVGNNNDVTDEGFGFSPGFLAVRYKPFKTEKLTIGVASFERFKTSINFNQRAVSSINETGGFILRADIDVAQHRSENWYGFAVSYNITNNVGIGISQFSVWGGQDLEFNLRKEVFPSFDVNTVQSSWRHDFSYSLNYYGGFISKIGTSFATDEFNIGLTFTSPMYNTVQRSLDYAIDDQKIIQSGEAAEVFSNRNKKDLINYKTPASFGIGLEWHMNATCLSISAEHFRPVDRYLIGRDSDDPFDGTSLNPELLDLELYTELSAVTNFAFGVQFIKNENVTWLAGFRTDLSPEMTLSSDEAQYLRTTPDIFHLSGGGSFRAKQSNFAIGIDVAYGAGKEGRQLANFEDVTSENLFSFEGDNVVDSRFISVSLFLTYDFIFQSFTRNQ